MSCYIECLVIRILIMVPILSMFGSINKEYSSFMGSNYPTRTCVEIELPSHSPIIISLSHWFNIDLISVESPLLTLTLLNHNSAIKAVKRTNLRVESRSNWASSIVGPYSQAATYLFNEKISNLFYSGLIGLRSFEHLLGKRCYNRTDP